jgi:hypothetical protein
VKRELIPVNAELWREFVTATQQEGKQPLRVLAQILRDYMQIQKETALFEKMRASVRGREMTEEEAVEFVHQYRRVKRLARNGALRRSHGVKRATSHTRQRIAS